jgi:hypothetical protein
MYYLLVSIRYSGIKKVPPKKSRWGRDFSQTSRPALGPTQPPVQWVPGLSLRYSGRGVVRRGQERVELYLYSPSRPSRPVIGRTLPFNQLKHIKSLEIAEVEQQVLSIILCTFMGNMYKHELVAVRYFVSLLRHVCVSTVLDHKKSP